MNKIENSFFFFSLLPQEEKVPLQLKYESLAGN